MRTRPADDLPTALDLLELQMAALDVHIARGGSTDEVAKVLKATAVWAGVDGAAEVYTPTKGHTIPEKAQAQLAELAAKCAEASQLADAIWRSYGWPEALRAVHFLDAAERAANEPARFPRPPAGPRSKQPYVLDRQPAAQTPDSSPLERRRRRATKPPTTAAAPKPTPTPPRKPNAAAIAKKLHRIEEQLRSADPLTKVRLIQERMNLTT